MKIVFAGSIGRFPVGGHAWVDMQYLLGLRRLGHEVYYLEDCGEESWVYDWQAEALTTSLEYPASYVRDCLEAYGLKGNWIYRAGDLSAGLDLQTFRDVCRESDLLIVRGAPIEVWRPEYMLPARRVFVDVDPGFTQFRAANGQRALVETLARCERLFTIGQRLGAEDCCIPLLGREWIRTVSPVSLSDWPFVADSDAAHFTTVMQWRSYQEVVYQGEAYGNKEKEFPKFIDLPNLTPQPIRIALTGAPPEDFIRHGWDVVEGWSTSFTPLSYQSFIQQSRAEFCVAKHGYVKTRGGWFSDRSVCYLASGRPVVVQETGWSDWLPVGRGALAFKTAPEAARAIDEINHDYDNHCRAARDLAEQYFGAETVLTDLLNAAMY
jgi:hypothetical protein